MIKKHFKSLPSLIMNHAGMILIGVLLLTLILGYQARYLKFHIGFDYLLPANNPRIETFNHLLDEFDNDANILTLRGRYFPYKKIQQIVNIWLNSKFSGKLRHKKRINKIE